MAYFSEVNTQTQSHQSQFKKPVSQEAAITKMIESPYRANSSIYRNLMPGIERSEPLLEWNTAIGALIQLNFQ